MRSWFALVAGSVLLLAACGGSATTCDSDCQDQRVLTQDIADQQAAIVEQKDEEDNIQATLAIEAKILTEAQQRAEIAKVIVYDRCVPAQAVVPQLQGCYAQLLASGFGAVR